MDHIFFRSQFSSLSSCSSVDLNEKFENFSENDSCLDDFYYGVIGQDKSYEDLWFAIKIILIFFAWSQASIESGFSIYSSIMVEKLLEESLVAERLVFVQLTLLVVLRKSILFQ